MEKPLLPRISRRDAIRWMVTASASLTVLQRTAFGVDGQGAGAQPPTASLPVPPTGPTPPAAVGYGSDPDLLKVYQPGDVWPLTFTEAQRQTTAALCDVIIPADDRSPSASQVKVYDFIDEWISAPYPGHDTGRTTILNGLTWLDTEATTRFSKKFTDLSEAQKTAICDDISYVGNATTRFVEPAKFFTLFRNLTAGGFYTTPEGLKDLQYMGNTASATFDGPPPEALRKVGLL